MAYKLKIEKGSNIQLSKHFNSNEMDCKCKLDSCLETPIDINLIVGLEKLRSIVGPLKITSGFRCKEHNAKIGGRPKSKHLLGEAADIQSKGMSSLAVAYEAERNVEEFRFGGIGRYQSFTHLDVRDGKARWGING